MKKILFLTIAVITAFAACSKPEPEGTGTGSNPDDGKQEEIVAATISLPASSINLGGSMFDEAEISVSTNQTKITPVCNQTWMTARMVGRILMITASEHNETGAPRTGTITITAGEGDNTATETLTVVQGLRDASSETPVIQLNSQPEDLAAASGSSTYVTYTTNQSEITVTFSEQQSWLTYKIDEGKVTFTAASANTSGTIRTVEVTLTAGTATATCTVRQFSDAPQGLAIGALYEGGMIFEIAADYVKIISLKEHVCFWATDEYKAVSVGTEENPDEGINNTETLRSHASFTGNFPAAEWCVSQGEGWYMPSRREYNTLIDNLKLKTLDGQDAAQGILAALGGDPFTIGTQYYWSCCEKSATNAHCVRLNDKAHGNFNKKGESGRPVRAVKKIMMDVAAEMDKANGSLGNFNITEETWTNN